MGSNAPMPLEKVQSAACASRRPCFSGIEGAGRSRSSQSTPTALVRRAAPGDGLRRVDLLVFPSVAPTSQDLLLDETRPYFLWWLDATVGDLRRHLKSDSEQVRAYWLGSLLREANSRDVWRYTTPEEVRALWPAVYRYLGKSRKLWSHLLQLPEPTGLGHGT